MSLRPWRMRTIAAGAALVTAGMLAACGSSSSSGSGSASSSSGSAGVLSVATGATRYPDDFNLYSPNAEDPTNGMIYEPLFFYNTAKAGDVKPWLGTSFAWSNGGQTLTVQLKHNVTWTDGKPFTSADVVFTFNQALHSTALNKFGAAAGERVRERPVHRDDQLHQAGVHGRLLRPRPGRDPAAAHLDSRSRTRPPSRTSTRSAPAPTC